MDIKQAKPSLSQEATSALNPTSGSSDSPSFMSQFVIRTMAGDLKGALPTITPLAETKSALPPTSPIASQAPPLPPVPPTPKTSKEQAQKEKIEREKQRQEQKAAEAAQKKLAQEKAAAEKAAAAAAKERLIIEQEARKKELRDTFEQAKIKITAKEFEAAIIDAQKIIDSPSAGWLAKWQAKRLINKAQRGLDKKIEEAVILPIAPAPISVEPATPKSAPANLPTIDEAPPAKPILPVPPAPQKTGFIPTTLPSPTPVMPLPPIPSITKPAPIESPVPKPAMPRESIGLPGTAAPRGESSELPGAAPRGEHSELYGAAPIPPVPAASIPAPLPTQTDEPTEVWDMKKIALVGLTSLAILVLIINGLWYFLKQPQPLTQVTPSPQPSLSSPAPPPIPTPLFRTDAQKIFALKTGQEAADFQSALTQAAQNKEPANNFVYLLFQNDAGRLLSLAEIASSTAIDLFDLPTQTAAGQLKNQLNMNRFTFFAYLQNSSSSSPFIPEINSSRLGLVIEIKNATSTAIDDLNKSLKDLEQLMPASLKILLPEAKNNLPAIPDFIADQYHGVNFRYIKIPDASLGIVYAIVEDKLLIATSRDSFRSAIDRLLEK